MLGKKLLVLVVTIIAVFVLWFVYSTNTKEGIALPFLDIMSGEVMEVKGNSIIIVGRVGEPGLQSPLKVVEFKITPRTVFERTHFVVTAEQVTSGQPFEPSVSVQPASLSEIKPGYAITSIRSKEDLSSRDKATALEVRFITQDFPRPANPITNVDNN